MKRGELSIMGTEQARSGSDEVDAQRGAFVKARILPILPPRKRAFGKVI